MKKLFGLGAGFLMAFASLLNAADYSVKSPDGKLEVKISDGENLRYSLFVDGKAILEDCKIGIETDKGSILQDVKLTLAAAVSKN